MNPFEFILIILGMTMIAGIITKRMDRGEGERMFGRHRRDRGGAPADPEENQRLRQEVTELKERINVLERITVDKENSLARQIEELRDR